MFPPLLFLTYWIIFWEFGQALVWTLTVSLVKSKKCHLLLSISNKIKAKLLTSATNKWYIKASCRNLCWHIEPANIEWVCFIGLLQGLSVFKHNLQHVKLVFVFVSHIPCKISSVPCVKVHISTQSVVSLSAQESFQQAEEFTQSRDLSVGGIGNCKDKSLQQLKSSFLFTRAFGISQISQIPSCPRSYRKPDHAHFQFAWRERWGSSVSVCVCVCVCIGGYLEGLIFVKVSVS